MPSRPCCSVRNYGSPTFDDRILPPQVDGQPIPLAEHLDLPVLMPGVDPEKPCEPNDIIGKISLDAKWHVDGSHGKETQLGKFTKLQVERLKQYALLMRLHRPIGSLLLLWPTLWALWIAGEGYPNFWVLIVFILGVILMRASGWSTGMSAMIRSPAAR